MIWNVKMVEQVGASELVVELGRDGVLIFVVDYSGQIIATSHDPNTPKGSCLDGTFPYFRQIWVGEVL